MPLGELYRKTRAALAGLDLDCQRDPRRCAPSATSLATLALQFFQEGGGAAAAGGVVIVGGSTTASQGQQQGTGGEAPPPAPPTITDASTDGDIILTLTFSEPVSFDSGIPMNDFTLVGFESGVAFSLDTDPESGVTTCTVRFDGPVVGATALLSYAGTAIVSDATGLPVETFTDRSIPNLLA